VLDAAVGLMSGGALTYDAGGAWAAAGTPDEAWLDRLMLHPYFARTPPKTTGRELFGAPLAAGLVSEGRALGLSDADIAATLTAWTAASIAAAYRAFAPAAVGEVVVGGGGAHNTTMLAMLRAFTGAPVIPHEAVGLSSDAKEALAFAVLGYETWHGRVGVLPEQTGARHASILGQITPVLRTGTPVLETGTPVVTAGRPVRGREG
jgi:anhydro-N-acetylmuramic acid kinase